MQNARMEIKKMIIYVNTEDMRSYALTPNVEWETIEVEVSDDFLGGGKRYDLDTQTWINDVIEPITNDEINAQTENKNIEFLSFEINRTETKLTQLYRLRDRNKSSEAHLSQIEELEDYSTDLMLVEDQEGYPLNATFPICPDFFSE